MIISSNIPDQVGLKIATFAGGCFWCIEAAFKHLNGVVKVLSGFTGGEIPDPTYEQVHRENTGHCEAVQVTYRPDKITYQELLRIFWLQIDPSDPDGQFADRGSLYRTAIFYHDNGQRRQAEKSLEKLANSGNYSDPIATKILPAKTFYPVNHLHQDYAAKHPHRYKTYKTLSGRSGYLKRNQPIIQEILNRNH